METVKISRRLEKMENLYIFCKCGDVWYLQVVNPCNFSDYDDNAPGYGKKYSMEELKEMISRKRADGWDISGTDIGLCWGEYGTINGERVVDSMVSLL